MIFYNKSKWGLLGVNEYISKRVNELKHTLINSYTHQNINSSCSTNVEISLQIGVFYAKRTQSGFA